MMILGSYILLIGSTAAAILAIAIGVTWPSDLKLLVHPLFHPGHLLMTVMVIFSPILLGVAFIVFSHYRLAISVLAASLGISIVAALDMSLILNAIAQVYRLL